MQFDAITDISELVLTWAQLTGQSPHNVSPAPFDEEINLPKGLESLSEWRFEQSQDSEFLSWMPFRIEDVGMYERICYVNTDRYSTRYHHRLVISYWRHNGPIIKQEFAGRELGRLQIREHVLAPGWIQVDDIYVYYGSGGTVYNMPISSLGYCRGACALVN